MRIIHRLFTFALACVLFICLGTPTAALTDFVRKDFVYDFTIHGLDGEEYDVHGFSQEYVLIAFGRYGEPNTQHLVSECEKLIEDGHSVQLVLLLPDDLGASITPAEYASQHPDLILSDDYEYNKLIEKQLYSRSGLCTNELPFMYLMDQSRVFKVSAAGRGMIDEMLAEITGELDETMIEVNYTGCFHQEEARSILKEINDYRTSGDAWAWNETDSEKVQYGVLEGLTYDYELERLAMARAADLAVRYSHSRPDGTDWFSVFPESMAYAMKGENIAALYTDADKVFTAWMEADRPYAGQGHRRNMLDPGFKAVGMACFEHDGYKFWVQEFSSLISDTSRVDYDESLRPFTRKVYRRDLGMHIKFIGDIDLYSYNRAAVEVGKKIQVPIIIYHLTVEGDQSWVNIYEDSEETVTSKDESIAKIEDDYIVGISPGTCKINFEVNYKGFRASIDLDLTVRPHEHHYVFSEWKWADDFSSASALFVCKDDSQTIEVPAQVTVEENDKEYVYTARVIYNSGFYTDTKTVAKQTEKPKPSGLKLDYTEVIIATNSSKTLKAVITPSEADQSVEWSSSNPDIASVDQNGNVTAHRYGTAVIQAKSKANPSLTASCRIQTRYYDVNDTGLYYYKPVYWAADRNITKGYDNVYFGPKNNCTREAVVTFLWRMAGKPDPNNLNSPFSDIQDPNKYYYKAVLWAAEQGITKGYDDGTFRPNAVCLREHVVTFLWRYAKKPNPKTTKNPFNDVSTSDYYYKATLWANENKIANGYSSGPYAGGFGPKLDCLREHVVTFLYRYGK